MKVNLPGEPEDVIEKLEMCEYCPFEELLRPEKRQKKVLDQAIPRRHINREILEQLCAMHYDEDVCPMKYAVMRLDVDTFTAIQLGEVHIFALDLCKRLRRQLSKEDIVREWTKKQDLGRGIQESYAARARKVWELSRRKDAAGREDQTTNLTITGQYELVVAKPATYETGIRFLEYLMQEHQERDNIGKVA
jgi:hypothetical protein